MAAAVVVVAAVAAAAAVVVVFAVCVDVKQYFAVIVGDVMDEAVAVAE